MLNGLTNSDVPIPIHIFWQLSYTTCSVITILYLLVYRRNILEIMEGLDSLLTRQDHKHLYIFTFLTFVGKLVLIAVTNWPYIILHIWFDYSKSGIVSYRHYLWLWLALNERALISISVYLTVVKVIQLAERRSIRSLMSLTCVGSERKSPSSVSARTVFNEVDAFIRVKDDAMKILSIFPFLSFSYMFIESVGSIIELQTAFSKKPIMHSYMIVIRLCVTFIHAFLISYMTSRFCSESEKELKQLELNVINSRDTKEWNFVLDKIKESKEYDYKAYGFFRINKQLLLTCCSSLISFTVLFAQLINPGR